MSKTKQVIVIRRDLNMRRGKEIAQGSHASCSWLACWVVRVNQTTFFHSAVILAAVGGVVCGILMVHYSSLFVLCLVPILFVAFCVIRGATCLTGDQRDWLLGRFTKVTLQVPDEQGLMDVYVKATDAGLNTVVIEDSGATEFHGKKNFTAVAIGPHSSEQIDPITGHLKVY